METPPPTKAIIIAFSLAIVAISCTSTSTATDVTNSTTTDPFGMMVPGLVSRCDGSIGECMEERKELEFATESNQMTHRMLAQKKDYISYDVLKRGYTPCKVPNAPYSNCRPSGARNPYKRGCNPRQGCRS